MWRNQCVSDKGSSNGIGKGAVTCEGEVDRDNLFTSLVFSSIKAMLKLLRTYVTCKLSTNYYEMHYN